MKRMLINAAESDEVRVAILDEDRLEDLDIETGEGNSIKGNIYRAQIINIEPSIQAAFVNFGSDRNGFLPLDEVNPKALGFAPKEGRSKKNTLQPIGSDGIRPKQEVLVQVTRDPIGQKGAALTTYVALPGQFLVYLPQTEGSGGISRRIEDSGERTRMKEKIAGLNLAADISVIVRTAGLERTTAELKRELKNLEKLFKAIQKAFSTRKEPGLLYREEGVALRMVRDYFHDDIGEVLVDEPETFTAVQTFFQLTLPKFVERVKFYDGRVPLFTRYHVEEQIDHTMTRHVPLPSGGSIVIDQTEALVAIDVNSGRTRQEKNIEDTALKTNLEAADEIARQLRLRNMGGIIVCDFIDMRDRKNRTKVQTALSKALANDKAQTTLGRIGQFGTIELLRQRMRTAGGLAGWVPCPHCEGVGRVRNPMREAMSTLRQLALEVASSKEGTLIEAKVPVQAALYLLNEKRYQLRGLEIDGKVKIHVVPAEVSEVSIQRTSDAFKFVERADEIVTREKMRPDTRAGAVTLADALTGDEEEPAEEEEEQAPPPRQQQRPQREQRQPPREGDRPREGERPPRNADRPPREGERPREGDRPQGPSRRQQEMARERRRRLRRESEYRMIDKYTLEEPGDPIFDTFPNERVRLPGQRFEPPAPEQQVTEPREIVEIAHQHLSEVGDGSMESDDEPVAMSDEVSEEQPGTVTPPQAQVPADEGDSSDNRGNRRRDEPEVPADDDENREAPAPRSARGEAGPDDEETGEEDEEDEEGGEEHEDAVESALDTAVKKAGGKPKPNRRGGRRRGGRGGRGGGGQGRTQK